MRFLLSILTGFSLIAGGSTSLVLNTSNINSQNHHQATFNQDRISFNEVQYLRAEEEEKSWTINFTSVLSSIKSITFEDGGLHSLVQWGSDRFEHHWGGVNNILPGVFFNILNDKNTDGLATQKTAIFFQLLNHGFDGQKYHYQLTFFYRVETEDSFSSASGVLTIGKALILND